MPNLKQTDLICLVVFAQSGLGFIFRQHNLLFMEYLKKLEIPCLYTSDFSC